MKKQPFLLAIIGVLTIGCHNSIEESIDDIIISNSNGDYTRSDVIDSITAKEIIANIGYDTTQFEDKSEYYLVENTYRFYKEDMIAIRNNHIQQSRSGSSATIPQHYRHINIELVSCVDPSIISPFNDATFAWNNVGSDIQFQIGTESDSLFPISSHIDFYESTSTQDAFIEYRVSTYGVNFYQSITINTGHRLWDVIVDNNKLDHLAMYVMGRMIGLSEVTRFNGFDNIMYSPYIVEGHLGQTWYSQITSDARNYVLSTYPVYNGKAYTTNWTPAPFGIEDHIVITGRPYTITMVNNSECCKDIEVTKQFVITDTSGNDLTEQLLVQDANDENKVTVTFPDDGQYNFYFKVTDNKLDILSPIHTEALTLTARSNRFEWDSMQSILLNHPLKIRYKPDLSDIQTRSGAYQVNYYLHEVMFNNENSTLITDKNALQVENDECTIKLPMDGCYYLEAITEVNGEVVNTDYCNITKLTRLPQTAQIVKVIDDTSDEDDSDTDNTTLSVVENSYTIKFPGMSSPSSCNRFGYLVEYEYEEMHSDMYERRIDWQWHLAYNLINNHTTPTNIKPLPTLYNYNYGSSYDWRKEYYTGHIYCPSDGIRETESMSILELPMQQLITNVVNHNDLVILSNNSRKIRVGE